MHAAYLQSEVERLLCVLQAAVGLDRNMGSSTSMDMSTPAGFLWAPQMSSTCLVLHSRVLVADPAEPVHLSLHALLRT